MNKKNKKLLIIGGIIVISLLIINGIYFFVLSDNNSGNSIVKSEEERYAEFEADIACQMAEAGENEDETTIMSIITGMAAIAEKHGFTQEDITKNMQKYQNDINHQQLVLKEVEKECPQLLELVELE